MAPITQWTRRVAVWLVVPAFALACGSSSDPSPCPPGKTCPGNSAGSSGSPSPGTSGAPGAEGGAPTGGPLAHIAVTPPTATVVAGQLQQFMMVATDSAGNTPFPYPTFTWSVSGGGSIGVTGLFSAVTAGGPYTVTVTSGAVSATASVTVTPAPLPTVTMGETTILDMDDSGDADMLLAQEATLANQGTLRSLSFYVAAADGNLRLGVYDATGPGGGPGAKKAETAEVVAKTGWNTADVVTPIVLPAGTYWLAFAPSSNDLHFVRANDGTGNIAFFPSPYGPMPDTFSTTPSTTMDRWSLYATLNP